MAAAIDASLTRSEAGRRVVKPVFCGSATEMGDAVAKFETGKAYLSGVGVVKNRAQGISWLQQSATQGLPDAKRLLANAS